MSFFDLQKEPPERQINPRQVVRRLSKSSVADLAKVFGKDLDTVFISMKRSGLQVECGNETVKELAEKNKTSPDSLLTYFVQ
jgi:hypothetical protein